jgi:hypothetical protein
VLSGAAPDVRTFVIQRMERAERKVDAAEERAKEAEQRAEQRIKEAEQRTREAEQRAAAERAERLAAERRCCVVS